MGHFRCFLNDASLKELHLEGRFFTWSNEKAHLTLERIDRAIVSREWDNSTQTATFAPLPPAAQIMPHDFFELSLS
jgi:hypothetical protein